MMNLKKILTGRQLREGDVLPRWYGVAYWDVETNRTIGYPVPLNLLVRLWRAFCFLGFRIFKHPTWIGDAIKEADRRTYDKAYRAGFAHGDKVGERRAIMVFGILRSIGYKFPDG